MSKLEDFYEHKASLLKSGEFSEMNELQWDALEEKIIREETLPRLMEQIAPILGEVKIPLSLSIISNPENGISLSFTKNCIQMSTCKAKPCEPDTPTPLEPDEFHPMPPHPICIVENKNDKAKDETKSNYKAIDPSSVIKKKCANHIVFAVFRYLSQSKQLDVLAPYLTQIGERPNRTLEKAGCFELGNIFLVATSQEIKSRNVPNIRWFDFPLSIAGQTMYLSTQWRNNNDSKGLQYQSFIKMIDLIYPNQFQFSEEDGYYVLGIKEKIM